eukprot:97815-Hanusia_phi.AAC.2
MKDEQNPCTSAQNASVTLFLLFVYHTTDRHSNQKFECLFIRLNVIESNRTISKVKTAKITCPLDRSVVTILQHSKA